MQVIAHNIMSQFTNRQLNITSKNKSKSTEKLVSGFKINRSADDAAGLQISEKMRWQIRGLKKCDSNIQDGISLLQVADGAMDEISQMMHRLRELAVQGLSDTYTDDDVDYIQDEMDTILDEIDRVADTTTFNGINLLKGEYIVVTPRTITTTIEAVTRQIYYTQNSVMPSWVTINGTAANQLTNDARMIMNNPLVDSRTEQKVGPEVTKYWTVDEGLPTQHDESKWDWTPSLRNNLTAVVDFSSIAAVTGTTNFPVDNDVNNDGVVDANDFVSVNNVYLKLQELVNTGFNTLCATCTDNYGVIFTTQDRRNEILGWEDGYYRGRTCADYIMIDDLLEDARTNPNSGSDIARKLVEKVINEVESKRNHFTHYVQDAGNPAKLVVYDFRDDENIVGRGALIEKGLHLRKSSEITIPAHTVNYTYNEIQEGLIIQTGAITDDEIPLHLYDVSSGQSGLDLRDNIDIRRRDYQYATTTRTETYLYEWEEKETDTRLKSPAYTYYDAHGERHYHPEEYETVILSTTPMSEWRTNTISERVLVGVSEKRDGRCLWEIDRALNRLNDIRTKIGAQQNRLEHAKEIDANTHENTQSSESKLRDTDMAEEMVNYSKHSILEQAGQAMLSQANQQPQGILTLLS